jgi:hypothetical protein
LTAAQFKLDYPGIEARGDNVVAAGSPAMVGKAFVTSVELNPAYVMDVVVHELFGHPEYGSYGTEYHLIHMCGNAPVQPNGWWSMPSGPIRC